jgi:hypothetical protein
LILPSFFLVGVLHQTLFENGKGKEQRGTRY